MKKRLIALVLILVMVLTFGLVACGPKPEEIEEIVDTTVQSIVDEALLRVLEEALTPEDLDALKTAIQAGQITVKQIEDIVTAAFKKFTDDQANASIAADVQYLIRQHANDQLALAIGQMLLKEEMPHEDAAVVYAEVGKDKHSYLPYAEVSVTRYGAIEEVVIGELFFPAGKLWTDNGLDGVPTIAYNNPWHSGFAAVKTAADAAKTLEAKIAAVDGKIAMTIGGKRFVSKWIYEEFQPETYYSARTNVITGQHIRFVADETFTITESGINTTVTKGDVLTDAFVAEHIEWYLKAVKATEKQPESEDTDAKKAAYNTANGVRILKAGTTAGTWEVNTEAKFSDGALNKTNPASTYRAPSGTGSGNLTGTPFAAGMEALADYLVSTNFQYAIAQTTSNNYQNVNFPKDTIDWGKKYDASGTALTTAATFQYAASYATIATQAYINALTAYINGPLLPIALRATAQTAINTAIDALTITTNGAEIKALLKTSSIVNEFLTEIDKGTTLTENLAAEVTATMAKFPAVAKITYANVTSVDNTTGNYWSGRSTTKAAGFEVIYDADTKVVLSAAFQTANSNYSDGITGASTSYAGTYNDNRATIEAVLEGNTLAQIVTLLTPLTGTAQNTGLDSNKNPATLSRAGSSDNPNTMTAAHLNVILGFNAVGDARADAVMTGATGSINNALIHFGLWAASVIA